MSLNTILGILLLFLGVSLWFLNKIKFIQTETLNTLATIVSIVSGIAGILFIVLTPASESTEPATPTPPASPTPNRNAYRFTS